MKYTNRHNLPYRVLRLLHLTYRPKECRYSVRHLCDSPRVRTLLLKEWDHIEMDYSDLLSTVIGISVHEASEIANKDDAEVEQKVELAVDGVVVAGRSDLFEPTNKIIIDTKVKSTDFLRFGMDDIVKQINYYAYMHRQKGLIAERAECDVWYRDWKLWKSRIEKDYPKLPYECMPIKLWTPEEQWDSLQSDVQYHVMKPMDCPDEFRWKRETTYAVMKSGQKRAVRVLDTEQEAQEYCIKSGDLRLSVVARPGECVRCKDFCPCRSVCPDAKNLKGD